MGVRFFEESTLYRFRGKRKIRKWIENTVKLEGGVPGDINIILCSDEFLCGLNFKYLKHNTLTDTITFPFEDGAGFLTGDIYISLPRVRDNAKKFNQTLSKELHRVMIHGVLHLTGHKDKTLKDKAEMTGREDYYLSLLED